MFLIRRTDSDLPLYDSHERVVPAHVVPVLANKDDIRRWMSEGAKIEFVNPDDRPMVLLESV